MGGYVDTGQGLRTILRAIIQPSIFPHQIAPVVGIFRKLRIDWLVDDAARVLINDGVIKKALDKFRADTILLRIALEGFNGYGCFFQLADAVLRALQVLAQDAGFRHSRYSAFVLTALRL